jgi:putative addiction module component (TIGR02574 family)
MREIEAIVQEVLELPPEQRARVAERLLESLDDLPDQEMERLWAREAKRRVQAADRGEIESYPADEVHREVFGRSQ